jgi:hypothetical protein
MPKVFKSQLVEIISPGIAGGNNATKIQFQDQPYLRGKMITAIEVINGADMTTSPTGKTIVTNAQMKLSYLTLYLNDVNNPKNVGEWIQNVPFTLMHRTQNAANDPFVRQMYELQGQVIYWEKCFISLASSLANTADVSFLFNVYFKN